MTLSEIYQTLLAASLDYMIMGQTASTGIKAQYFFDRSAKCKDLAETIRLHCEHLERLKLALIEADREADEPAVTTMVVQ